MINLTPHPITIRTADGGDVTFQPSGMVARVEMVEDRQPSVDVGGQLVPVIFRAPGRVIGLPDDPTVPVLVSSMVLNSLPDRPRTYAPDTGDTAIRDNNGRIVAVTRLVTS